MLDVVGTWTGTDGIKHPVFIPGLDYSVYKPPKTYSGVEFKYKLDDKDILRNGFGEMNLGFYTKKDEDVLATAFKTFKKYANKDEEVSKIAHFDIHKVIKSGNAVIVFWSPKEKTIVRLKDDDTDDIYSAVAQAIAKRMYGSTSKFHKMIDKALVGQKEK